MDRAAAITEEQERIVEEFALFEDPREKLEYLIDLGKALPALDERYRTEGNKVRGCQSQVWLVAEYDEKSRRLRLRADSDAIIVRGLIALLLRLYSDRAPAEILTTPPGVFERVGLGRLLTPGRQNGLYAMTRRIQQLAAVYARLDEGRIAAS